MEQYAQQLSSFSERQARANLPYRFEYWAPKADLNLKVKRLITLSSADRSFVTSNVAIEKGCGS